MKLSRSLIRLPGFILFYLWELLVSSLRVARTVLTPGAGGQVRPAVVTMPLRARTDAEITVLASLISLTPGTLSLDVSDDRQTLLVHVMDLPIDEGGPEHAAALVTRDLSERLERRVLALMRGEEGPW